MFSRAAQHPLGKRKRETQIINQALASSSGNWEASGNSLVADQFFETLEVEGHWEVLKDIGLLLS